MPIETENLSQQDSEQLGKIAAWARQTIAFAMSVRNSATTRNLGDPSVAFFAAQEARQLTDEIWEEAARESETLPAAEIVFAEKVFDWCHKHINP